MSATTPRQIISTYLQGHGSDLVADDATYTLMATGEQYSGSRRIRELITYFYEQAFDARADLKTLIADENSAVGEFDFTGTHIGEFMGIAPTNRLVHVPMCIVYTVADGLIHGAHIYFELDALRAQLRD